MGINAISWRRIRTLNERLGERFVHVYTISHHKHWLWTGIRIDGTSATIDTQQMTVEEDPAGWSTTTLRLLRDRSKARPEDLEWLAELDDRARQLDGKAARRDATTPAAADSGNLRTASHTTPPDQGGASATDGGDPDPE